MAYPIAAVAIAIALVVRPSVARDDMRWLDVALVLYVAFVVMQLVPLVPGVRLALSPATRAIDLRLRLDAPANALADSAHPLTVDAEGTLQALALSVAVVLTFWCARELFSRRGIRAAARTIAGFSLALAAFGVAQHVVAPHSLYWLRTFTYTTPFGPYLNRSDFAMWFVLAMPLTAGYLLARLHSRARSSGEIFTAFDDTATFLTIALGFMAAALVVGLSRSGMVGAAAGMLTLWALSERRLHRQSRAWLLGGLAALAVLALAFANTAAVATRIEDTVDQGMGGRLAIWRATLPIVHDFWLTGAGAGAYQRTMMVYQPAPHETYFNHAHDEYLQLVAEGGVWLMMPAAIVLVSGVAAMRRRLRADRTAIYWVRAGAVGGIVGVAVQSLWETGLRRPANTLLFAVVAAVALHSAAELPRSPRVTGETTSARQ